MRDLFEDLRDGHNLLSLLEVLSGEILVRLISRGHSKNIYRKAYIRREDSYLILFKPIFLLSAINNLFVDHSRNFRALVSSNLSDVYILILRG